MDLGTVHSALPATATVGGTEPLPSAATVVPPPRPPEARLKVALYKGPGTGGQGPPSLMRRLNRGGESSLTEVSPEQMRAGALTNFQAVIFAGGSGSKQAEALGEVGREAVRQFVAAGGAYVGICAGAYLATAGYPWSLGLVDAKTVSPKWQRGRALVKIELTPAGEKLLGPRPGQFDVRYVNGPIVKPAGLDGLPDFETLALFRSEVASNGAPVGVMVDSPAILTGRYQQGRVVCVSPHPEQTQGLEDFVPGALAWAVGAREEPAAD